MNYITMDVIARTIFGIDLTDTLAEQMRVDFARLLTLFGYGFIGGASRPLRWLADRLRRPRLAINVLRRDTTIFAPRTMRGLRRIERFLNGLIADYRSGKVDRTDNLLALLIAAEDAETGYRYSDLEIRDEPMTFLGAGFETTAAALAWTWYLLSENPDARSRLGRERDEVLAGREPTADDVENLPWTRPSSPRRCADTRRSRAWRGWRSPTTYSATAPSKPAPPSPSSSTVSQRRFWADPHTFDPRRFLKENFEPWQRRAHIPFGAGR